MRIVVDNSGYGLSNLGDISMLQAAVRRLTSIWPDAHVQVLTGTPERLRRFCPEAHPLVIPRLALWLRLRDSFRIFGSQLDAMPRLAREFLARQSPTPTEEQELVLFGRSNWDGHIEAVHHADLVVATGGGYINDMFRTHAASVMETLKVAQGVQVPTAILSNGFDPIKHPALVKKARAVLPAVNLIACREGVTGPDVLRELGVPEERIVVTGDDAVELAYNARTPQPGANIAVNIRLAWYAGIDDAMIDTLRDAIRDAAARYQAELLPVPISLADPSDVQSLRRFLRPLAPHSDGGNVIDTPEKAIRRIGECRVVIAGSYHAAVFALSQGVPVVALAKAAYYKRKFEGVSAQFPGGCIVTSMDHPHLYQTLTTAIDDLWTNAETLRPQLLAHARQQIELGWSAYQQLRAIVEGEPKLS
jgi:polysaccharide pyruvyl transferase WcaK-like protein